MDSYTQYTRIFNLEPCYNSDQKIFVSCQNNFVRIKLKERELTVVIEDFIKFLSILGSLNSTFFLQKMQLDPKLLEIIVDRIKEERFHPVITDILDTQNVTKELIEKILDRCNELANNITSKSSFNQIRQYIADYCRYSEVMSVSELIEYDKDKVSAFSIYSEYFVIPDDIVSKYENYVKYVDTETCNLTLKMYELLRPLPEESLEGTFFNKHKDLGILEHYSQDFIPLVKKISPTKFYPYMILFSEKSCRTFCRVLSNVDKEYCYVILKSTKGLTADFLFQIISEFNLDLLIIRSYVFNYEFNFLNDSERQKVLDFFKVHSLVKDLPEQGFKNV